MTRRRTTTGLILVYIVGLFGWLIVYTDSADAATVAAAQTPPNVVVVMVDDMRADDLAAMPKTKALLDTRFTRAHVNVPLCCPSRATFLTGQYAHHHGVLDNDADGLPGGFSAFNDEDEAGSLPVALQTAPVPYETVLLGKYLNKYPGGYVPPGWDRFVALNTASRYRDFRLTVGSTGPAAEGQGQTVSVKGQYQTTHLTDRAVNQLQIRLPGGEPVFMWLSFFAPHGTGARPAGTRFVPTEARYDGTSRVGLPPSPAFNEQVVSDKPPWVRSYPKLDKPVRDLILTHRRERRESLRSVDDAVARVVATLRGQGEWQDTVILFTSDNGFLLGEHRIKSGKVFPYMEAARVPLLAHGPGFTPGVESGLVSNVDLATTIAALGGTTMPAADGVDLRGDLTGRGILLEYRGDPPDEGLPRYYAIRRGDWTYVEYDSGQRELYDLAADPWQRVNVAGRRPAVQAGLAAELAALRAD